MKRPYSTESTIEQVTYFTGTEIERTNAYGLKTLFVATQKLDELQIKRYAKEHKCEHIYVGANKCIRNYDDNLRPVIRNLLKEYHVTIDYPYRLHEDIKMKFSEFWKNKKFTAMVSFENPHVEHDVNVYFKWDDRGFNSTNEGVYVIPVKDTLKEEYKTNWEDYGKDEILK
jgi:hypothetical protein